MDNVFLYKNSFLLHEHVKSKMYFGDYSKCPKPRISIILPVYNRPQTLEKALLSAINQEGFKDYEIVVVDNNENHPSPNLEVVRLLASESTNVFYYQHDENIGMYGNFNRGVQMARGQYVTFCHDDDFLEPRALELLSSFLNKNNGEECVIAEHKTVDVNYKVITESSMNNLPLLKKKEYYRYSQFDMFVRGAGIGGGGSLFKRDVIVKLGGFREDLYPGSDYALYINYQHLHGCFYLTIPTYNYRVADNESKNVYEKFAELNRFYMQCMKQYINVPDFILDLIIKSKYITSVLCMRQEWGGDIERMSMKERFYKLVYVAFRGVSKIKAYSF